MSVEGWRAHTKKQNQYKRNISMAIPLHNKLPANNSNLQETRKKLQSGSLPARSKFFIHQKSAKSYANSNYRGNQNFRVDAGRIPPPYDYVGEPGPKHSTQTQNMTISNEGEEETHQ